MPENGTLVIIGGGLAGAKAAEGARTAGYDDRIVVVGDEHHAPYERPPLSKDVLRGEADPGSTAVHAAGFYADNNIELVTRGAKFLDTYRRTVTFESVEPIEFETAIIATGAAPRRLEIDGEHLDGVHYLRTIDEALDLKEAIRGAARVAVIGAGWIGTEVTASARLMGTDVVLIDPEPVPLQRVLGDKIGGMFADLHAEHGVTLRLGLGVVAITGSDRVEAVTLSDGTSEPVDAAIIGVGVAPRTEILDPRGHIEINNGVVVNERLETAVKGVYAVGDVANAFHPLYGRHIRVEHWANALNQGLLAGSNAAGGSGVYDRLPYFYSDQYDLGLEYVGHPGDGDELVVRGDVHSREFIAAWHEGGAVTAAMNVNVWDVVEDLKTLITARQPIDIAKFIDPSVPLGEVVP